MVRRKCPHGHSTIYGGPEDVILKKARFRKLAEAEQSYTGILEVLKECGIVGIDRVDAATEVRALIRKLQNDNAVISKECDEIVDYYESEVEKLRSFRIEQIVECYNRALSELYYSIFSSDDFIELRNHANLVIKKNAKLLQSCGIETRFYIPGQNWNEADISEEPQFVSTSEPEFDNKICNCRLFGISFRDDFVPSILPEIEVYRYFAEDESDSDQRKEV